jgi:hypothetical protein
MALRKAIDLEKRGKLSEAVRQFELVAEKAGEGHPSGAMALERARQLKPVAEGIIAESSAAPDRPRSGGTP